jgi:CheY-like chemotaxis protein
MIQNAILIDDDNEDINFLRDAIVKLNHRTQCLVFTDPCEAVEYFQKSGGLYAELVVIDYSMPKMNGLECLERLSKSVGGNKSIRFIVYSGSGLPKDIENKIIQLGAEVIQKPDTYSQFSLLAGELLKGNRLIN